MTRNPRPAAVHTEPGRWEVLWRTIALACLTLTLLASIWSPTSEQTLAPGPAPRTDAFSQQVQQYLPDGLLGIGRF
ncbi:hypothetical protein LG293_17565 (plasmid) [Citricoccus nitrophenolicus]